MRWTLKARLRRMRLLDVENLSISFIDQSQRRCVVDQLSFSLEKGETLGIVGESGSGKSVSCLALLGLLPKPAGRVEGGGALFLGEDLLSLSQSQLRRLRGKEIGMVFQDPSSSLNPYLKIGTQLTEGLRLHERLSSRHARRRAIEALESVGIAEAEARLDDYPHVFSGGMRQRVMIAMAILLKPRLIIADEPTTALDVTVQSQILTLLKSQQHVLGTGMILITHDLGVAARMCDRLVLLKNGKVEESGLAEDIFYRPKANYTKELLAAVPVLPTFH